MLHGLATASAARRRAGELLGMVGLGARAADRYPHELSGGMCQRAAIAMALACQPQLILADEPTTALDGRAQAQILELLGGLTRESGVSLLLVTHDLPVVAQVCEQAVVVHAGEAVESGPVEGLRRHPRHPYTRRLSEASPDLHGRPASGRDSPGPATGPRSPCARSTVFAQPPCRETDPELRQPNTATAQHHAACILLESCST